ncbi:unknown [Clostridium sp. CAG:762]|jgi:hypothetical protein|nr:unknown [Clostridium sp. CAG:762]
MGDELKKYEYFIKLDASNIKDGTNVEKSIENYKKHTRMLEELREVEYEKNLLLLEENYKMDNEMYTATEERDRLDTIIKLIEERIKQRNITKKEYDKVLKPYDKGKEWFFKELENDIEIKNAQNLEDYTDRLKKIKVFIKRNEDIIALREKNNSAEIALKDALTLKNTNDTANNILENNLQSFFAENFYASTELDDIGLEELLEIEKIYAENIKLKEERILKKLNAENRANPKSKDIKEKLKHERDSIKALKTNHYLVGNKIRMISLSALVETECFDYDAIKSKREKILNILEERENQIKKYRLQEDSSNYHGLGILVEKQLKEIKSQEKNNKLVKQLRESISKNNQEIEKLELANNEPEYQDISMEFASSYSNLPQQEDNFEPVKNFEQNYIIEEEKEPKNNSEVKLTEDQIKTIKEALLQYNMENKPIVKEEKNLTEINDMPDIKYDNWENNEPTKAEPTTKEEDKTKEPHSEDIPVISLNQTLGNNKSNSVIENEKEFVPLTDYEKQEKHEEEEYNLDSFIPDKESYNLPSEPEEKSHEEENEEYNLDNLIETVEPNNEKEKAELNDESGLDALIERVSPTNNDQEEYDLDNLIDNSKTDNIEDNTFASVVSVDSLPDEIKNNNPRERGKGVLKTVLEQLGISYENAKPKRRSL